MCKPKICKTISWVNHNEPNVNFSPPYANHKILVIPKSFTKSLHVTAYFCGLITCPTFLVQSGEVTFWGEKSLHGLHWFTQVYIRLPPDVLVKQIYPSNPDNVSPWYIQGIFCIYATDMQYIYMNQ